MSCERYLDLISARLDGAVTAQEEAELSAHLRQCPACRVMADDFQKICDTLAGMRQADAPVGLADGVMARIRAQRGARSRRTIRQLAGLAACFVLCLGVARYMGIGAGSNSAAPRSSAAASIALDTEENQSFSRTGSNDVLEVGTGMDALSDKAAQPDTKAAGQEPGHYGFANDRYLRVTWGSTPAAPCAQILGSMESLAAFAARLPEDDLSELIDRYEEEFFAANRLLAVIVEEPSGSITHRLDPQGLSSDEVTVLRTVPEAGDCDMAAWLIVAEVNDTFRDGDTLAVALSD